MYYHSYINYKENSMYIYLPIAEQPIHSLVILGVAAVGSSGLGLWSIISGEEDAIAKT